jgi:O-antigen ligase
MTTMRRAVTALRQPARWTRLLTACVAVEAVTILGAGLGLVMTTPFAPLVASATAMLVYSIIFVVAPYQGLLLWLILYPFAETRVNIPLGANVADLSATRLAAVVLCAVLMAQVAIGRRPLPRLTRLDLAGVLLIGGLGFSALFSYAPIRAAQVVLDGYLMPLVFYFVIRHLVTQPRDVERLFSAVLIIAGYSALFAFYEHLTGQIVLSPETYTLTEYAAGIRILRSLWGSNSIFGSVFGMAIPVAFYRMLQSPRGLTRAAYALLAGVFLIGMFFTFKRSAWIAMLVSFLVLALFLPAFRRVLLVLVIVTTVPVAASWNRVVASNLMEQRVTANIGTLNGRTGRWQSAIELWTNRPVVGYGFQNYDLISGYRAVESHYFHILVSGGLIAFVPFMLFLVLVLQESLRLYVRGPSQPGVFVSRPVVATFLAMASIYAVKAISEVQSTPTTFILLLLVGAVIGSQPASAPAKATRRIVAAHPPALRAAPGRSLPEGRA